MVRERCKFFQFSQVEGPSTPFSIVAVNNFHPSLTVGGPFSPLPLQPLSFFRLFDKGRSDRYDLISPCIFFLKIIYISVIFHKAESFSCDIFKNSVSKAELLRSALWSSALFWIPPTPTHRGHQLGRGVSSCSPEGRWMWSAACSFPAVTKSRHKAAAHVHVPRLCFVG